MIEATEHNFTFHRRETLEYTFEFYEDDGVTPFSLTGYSVRSEMRPMYDSPYVVNLNPTILNNTITLNLTSAETAKIFIKEGTKTVPYYYDVIWTPPSGKPECVIKGVITYNNGVTR